MKRLIFSIFALISVLLLNVYLYYQYGFRPLLLQADTIDSYVDYDYYDVPDFDGYTPILKSTTPDLEFYLKMSVSFDYTVDYCPINGLITSSSYLNMRMYDSGGYQLIFNAISPNVNLNCLQPYEPYYQEFSISLKQMPDISQYVLDIHDNYNVLIQNFYRYRPTTSMYGYTITFSNVVMRSWFEIHFNNTYLMSTFLLDTSWGQVQSYDNDINRPFVLYTETATDTYNVYNENLSTSFDTRKKFAIAVPDIQSALLVNKIGTGLESVIPQIIRTASSSEGFIWSRWDIWSLNASPMATPFEDATIDTTPNYASCNEGLFGWPVECTIDGQGVSSFQAMANDLWEWISKDSPIVSDLLAVAGSGFQWLDNSLQFLGFFSPTTLLGAGIWIGVAVLLVSYGFNGGE